MSRHIAFGILALAATLTAIWAMLATGCTPRKSESPSKIEKEILSVAVQGLPEGEAAFLQLVPDNENARTQVANKGISLPQISIQNGTGQIRLREIPDGYYQLTIDAPWEYFREPGGYLIRISDHQIVQSIDHPIEFVLVPPAAQQLPPCRVYEREPDRFTPIVETAMVEGETGPVEEHIACISEALIDLAGPPKQPEP